MLALHLLGLLLRLVSLLLLLLDKLGVLPLLAGQNLLGRFDKHRHKLNTVLR